MHCTVLYCTVLYCTVLYCTVLYCTVLYCTAGPDLVSKPLDLEDVLEISKIANYVQRLDKQVETDFKELNKIKCIKVNDNMEFNEMNWNE